MYSDNELENIACGCLLAGALLDFAKGRARSSGAKEELRFFGLGRDRFLFDHLHEKCFRALMNFESRTIIEESVRALSDEFACGSRTRAGFWTTLAADFTREFDSGRVPLIEIDWE